MPTLICLDQRTGTGCTAENKDGAQFCTRCGRPLRFAVQLRNPGDVVGDYRVMSVIGHGGFGAVYLAEALSAPGQKVALKETFDPDQIQSYQAEFAVLARLQHPHLPRYYRVFEADGNGYLVMEYVPGQSLQEVLDKAQGPLLEVQVLGYALQLCEALAFLHSQNPTIIHRDIKPANVRLTPEGVLKLVDFGLVKEGSGATRSSRRGVTPAYAPPEQWVTPAYAPPEQWGMGGQHTDARSDLYALGATLYHLLTGQEPPPATDRIATSNDPLAPPLQLNPKLTPAVAAAVTAALVLHVDRRPADAQTVKRLLLQQDGAPGVLPPARAAAPASLPASQVPSPLKAVAPKPVAPKPAEPAAGTVREYKGIRFVYVPAGEFLMGSPKGVGGSDEQPQHMVTLDGYWIGETEVTNEQYGVGVAAGGCTAPGNRRWKELRNARHPVVTVDWSQAAAFAHWVGGRLPTEAEWEKAARGTDGRIYPWGDAPPNKTLLNFSNQIGDTTPVGSYRAGASPYGALDMAGNVWEWMGDWYGEHYYSSSPGVNPPGPANGSFRVLRGGAFHLNEPDVRAAYRVRGDPASRFDNFGFRVVVFSGF